MRIWAWQFGRPIIKSVDDVDAWEDAIESGAYAPFALLDDYGRVIRGQHPEDVERKLRQIVIDNAPRTRFWYSGECRGTAEWPNPYGPEARDYRVVCEQWVLLTQVMYTEVNV